MLDGMTATTTSQVQVGGRTFRIIANPVISEQGERLGVAVEWADLTAELAAQEEERKRLESERQAAAANLRLKVALDNVSSNVMVADALNKPPKMSNLNPLLHLMKTGNLRLTAEAEEVEARSNLRDQGLRVLWKTGRCRKRWNTIPEEVGRVGGGCRKQAFGRL